MAFWDKIRKPAPPSSPPQSDRAARIRAFLQCVTFDTSGWEVDGESVEERMKQWVTPEGDFISLTFIAAPTREALPESRDIEDFRRNLHGLIAETTDQGDIVELGVRTVSGMSVLRQIIKVPIPDREHGLVYIGSYTIPFKKISYVVKVQCVENGVTGLRESILFAQDRAGSAGHTFEDGKVIMPDWNPDAEEFDAEFPEHPLSRLRLVMARLEESLTIAPALLESHKPFPLPPSN